MKKSFLITAFLIVAISANAQTKTVANHSLTLQTIGASYSYEQPLSRTTTLTGSAGLTMPYLGWAQGYGWCYSINPVFGLEPRFYYNMDSRKSKGRNTNYNSSNYLSVACLYLFKPVVTHNTSKVSGVMISPNWGMRRVYNDRWLLELSLGVGCFWSSAEYFYGAESTFSWGPRINFKFGIVL